MPETLDWKPVADTPPNLQWESIKPPEAPSILSETLKAPARVVGGIAQEAGEATQYVTGDRIGGGVRNWGVRVQQQNAQTPEFRAEHPILSTAGDVAEGVAKMAPYLAADAAISAVAPEAGLPAAAGLVARGIRTIKAAPFTTAVLPVVAGAAQGQRSYETGVQNGLTPDQALQASYAPAAVTGVGMAAMGGVSHALQGIGGEAQSALGGFAKHAAADTAIMMGQGVATQEAEKLTGIDPEAKPLDQLKDPKAWLNAALTGGMFAGLGVAQKGLVARALKAHTDALDQAPPEERSASVEALAQAVHPEDPAAQASFTAETMDKLQAGEPVLSEELVNKLTATPSEDTRQSVIEGLQQTVKSGGEIDPIAAHNDIEAGKVLDEIVPAEPVKMPRVDLPAPDPVQIRADLWAKEGRTISKLDGAPDAEVAARLDDMGYALKDNGVVQTGGKPRREWAIEKRPEEVPNATEEGSRDQAVPGEHQDGDAAVPQDGSDRNLAPEDQTGGGQASRGDLVRDAEKEVGAPEPPRSETVNGVTRELAPEQAARYDQIKSNLDEQKANISKQVEMGLLDKQEAGKRTKAASMAAAAELRQVHPDFRTAKEVAADAKREASNFKGKEVIHEGEPATVVGQAFGKVKLRLADGSEKSVPKEEVQTRPKAVPIADREQRLAYEDNPNLVVARKDGKIALIDQKEKSVIGMSEIKGGKLGDWVEGKEPATPAERVQTEALFRRHLGEDARLNRADAIGTPKADIEAHLKDIIPKLKVPVEVVDKAADIEGLRPDAPDFNGAFHQGKIYLNAEHLSSVAEAEHVLLKHELAHAGLLGSLGRDGMEKVLAKAWGDLNSDVREFAKEKGIDTTSKTGKLEATEEFLVHLAEQGSKSPVWDRFVQVFKAAMRKLGFDMKYSEGELRSLVQEATASMRADKAQATAQDLFARFSRVASEAKPEDVNKLTDETSTQVAKRVLSDTAGNIFRAVMPIDKTIKMAQSLPEYAPIKENLTRLQELRRAKESAGTAPSIDAKHVTDEVQRLIKTDADLKTYNDLTHKATLYELHADPKKPIPWTEKSWKEGGKEKQTGLSLGQAVKEVRELWGKLTPEQQAVQQRAVAHMAELKKEHIEAQVDGLRAIFPEDTFDKALEVSHTLEKELWKAEQVGGTQARAERRAELSSQHGADVMDLAEQISDIKSEGMLKGDYAPLMRFGDHVVTTFTKTAGGEGKRLKVQHFESKGEAMSAVRAAQSDPRVMATYSVQPESQRSVVNIPLEFLSKMQRAMDAKGIPADQQEALMQDFRSARVATMPRNSLEGNRLNREGIAGYEENAVRSYAAYVQRSSQAIANLKYGTKIDQTFRDMDNNIKAYQDPEQQWDPHAVERMSTLKDNLYTLEKQHNIEKINAATKLIGKSTFLAYLTSPSVYAVQWSQPFITTIPKLASRYGFGSSFTNYVKEAKNFMAGKFSDEAIDKFDRDNGFVGKEIFQKIEQYRDAVTDAERAKLSGEMKTIYDGFNETEQKLLVLKVMSHQGAIDLSAAHSLHDLVNSTDPLNKGLDWVVDKGGVFMRASETGSRRAAAVSAFQMALKDRKDFMKANDYASNIIDDTLYDFSSQNRAAIMKGNVGRVIGQFQFFRLHMLGKTMQLAKDSMQGDNVAESRKELAYMMGTSMALAGAAGTPLAMLASNTVTDALWGAVSFLFGDPDNPWDPKKDFEEAMKDAVGDDATNTFMKGLPYLMGLDISKRVGLGGMADVIQGEVPPGASATDKANWYAAKILGPSWGLVTDGIKAVDAVGNGDYGTAAQAGSPKVLRDFLKTYQISQEGVHAAGGRTVLQPEDVNPFGLALQMVGINPADVSLAQEEARELSALSTQVRQRRNLLTKKVTDATLAGDFDAREEALQGINEWGQKHPVLKITQQELANAVKRGMDLKAGKLSNRDELLKEGGA